MAFRTTEDSICRLLAGENALFFDKVEGDASPFWNVVYVQTALGWNYLLTGTEMLQGRV